jgi:hypothetical protein
MAVGSRLYHQLPLANKNKIMKNKQLPPIIAPITPKIIASLRFGALTS